MIATYTAKKVFLINTKTNHRVHLINLKKLHKEDTIKDVQQISKYLPNLTSKTFTDLEEIMIHFELQLRNKDGGDETLTYC